MFWTMRAELIDIENALETASPPASRTTRKDDMLPLFLLSCDEKRHSFFLLSTYLVVVACCSSVVECACGITPRLGDFELCELCTVEIAHTVHLNLAFIPRKGTRRRLASRGEVLVQLTIICSDSEEGVYCPLRLFAVQVSMYLLERDSNVQMLRRDEPRPRLG